MADVLKNIAIIGASGNLGAATLKALLKQGKHQITVLTRPSSKAEYPSQVVVKKGDYDDKAFLESALQGQDVLIVMLGFAGLSHQDLIFEAAGRAGVKYLFPSDYGADISIRGTSFAAELVQTKRDTNKRLEDLGIQRISVVTGSWTDYCLEYGIFGIAIPERKAELYTDGAPFNTTTVSKVAEAIARCLALDPKTIDQEFANGTLYVSSFRVSQPDLFQTVLRVTGTTEADWAIERKTTHDLIADGEKMVKDGDSAGKFKILFGGLFQSGMGGEYTEKVHNGRLGLQEEDLEEVVKASAAAAKSGGWGAGSTYGT